MMGLTIPLSSYLHSANSCYRSFGIGHLHCTKEAQKVSACAAHAHTHTHAWGGRAFVTCMTFATDACAPELNTLEVLFSGRIPPGGEQQSISLTSERHETCMHATVKEVLVQRL